MENALNALERNKTDPTEGLRQIFQSPDTRYEYVKLAVGSIGKATYKEQVLLKPVHTSRYIRLALIILEQKSHRDHLSCEDWRVIVDFLTVAYTRLRDTLKGIEFIKNVNELFIALSLLMKSKQSCDSVLFGDILATCRDFIQEVGLRETSCHPYIMCCIRILFQLGYEEAAELGELILELGKVRNQTLAYEMLSFACLKPQMLTKLEAIEPRVIDSYEVEFVSSIKFSILWFRPSGEADLTKFVGARALSLAIVAAAAAAQNSSHTESSNNNSPPSKRIRKENEDNRAIRLMREAFRGDTREIWESTVEWLGSESQINVDYGMAIRRNSANTMSWRSKSPAMNTKQRTGLTGQDATTIFWAFVVLGQSVNCMNKEQQLLVWNLCLDYIPYEGCTSGVCFCLSQLTNSLVLPKHMDSTVMSKLKWLLNSMGSSSHPILTSGSLVLYSTLYSVKILDDEFQKFKNSQLTAWLRNRVRDGTPQLITHLFSYECPPVYLQSEVADNLAEYTRFTRVTYLKNVIHSANPLLVCAHTASTSATFMNISPLITSIPMTETKSIKDALWTLAILAKVGHHVSLTSQTNNDAFTEEDLQAIVWFANLAYYFQWDGKYCQYALSLAQWDTPATNFESVERAISLLQLPGPVVSAAIAGYSSPNLDYGDNPGIQLRKIEPFLKSYAFQRSPWFLKNLTNMLGTIAFTGVDEKLQLMNFLLKTSLSQSQFSLLRLKIGKLCKDISSTDFISLLTSTYENGTIEILEYSNTDAQTNERLSMACFDIINALKSSYSKLVGALLLTHRAVMSISQLLVMISNDEHCYKTINVQDIELILDSECRIAEADSLLANIAAPLYFTTWGPEEIDPLTVLKRLRSSDSLIDRVNCFMRQFRDISLEASYGHLEGIAEQVLKEVSYCGSDSERELCIKEAFRFIQAHNIRISDSLLSTFFQGCCALLVSNDSDIIYNKAISAIEQLVSDTLKERENPDLFCKVAGCLSFCGLDKLSFGILLWCPKAEHSTLLSLLQSLQNLDLDGLPNILLRFMELEENITYEVSHMILKSLIRAIEAIGAQNCVESCLSLPESVVKYLFSWTNCLILPHSTAWMYFLARLSVLLTTVDAMKSVEMESNKYARNSWKVKSSKSGIEAFYDVLLEVYRKLPYHKKWKLHSYFQRDRKLLMRHAIKIPDDIFGQENWKIEADSRPHLNSSNECIDEKYLSLYRSAEKIANLMSNLLEIPFLGPHIFEEVPELLSDVLPYMVAAYYSSSDLKSKSKSFKSETVDVLKNLQTAIQECLCIPEKRRMGLEIIERCYIQCYKVPVSFENIVIACRDYCQLNQELRFIELGTLFAEHIWNEAPNSRLDDVVLDALSYFYSNLPEKAFKYALPGIKMGNNNNKNNNMKDMIFESLRDDESFNSWQKLEFDMMRTEAEIVEMNGQEKTTLEKSFQNVGLWNIANRIATEPRYYDFEKSWWLQEWDTIRVPRTITIGDIFQNCEFAALIGFFTGSITEEETFAELLRTRSDFVHIFEQILHPSSLTELDTEVANLEIIRRGRELILKSQGDIFGLANEFRSFCNESRQTGDINKSLEYAIKLNNLASSSAIRVSTEPANTTSMNINLQALSYVETAKTEWELGRQSAALMKLKELAHSLQNEDNSSKITPTLVDIGGIYSTVGTWSRAARNEPDSVILNSYFLKAEESVTESSTERVFHEFARFCDEACHDQALQQAIEDSERVKENEQHQVEYLSRAIQSGTTDKAFQHKYRISLRMLKAEREDLEELKQRKMDLTLRSIRNYLLSMQSGDTYKEDMDRFVALWLSLWENPKVNRLVYEQIFGQGGTSCGGNGGRTLIRKLLPWMNQLTSRLMPDNSEFQQTLSKVVVQAARDHPHHTMWQLINILRTQDSANHTASERKAAAKAVIDRAVQKTSKIYLHMSDFAEHMVRLGTASIPEGSPKQLSLREFGTKESHWWASTLPKLKLLVPTATVPVNAAGNYSNVPHIYRVQTEVDIAGGISAPKIIVLVDSAGNTHKMVLKGSDKDDMRQDAIMQQVFSTASELMATSSLAFSHAKGMRSLPYQHDLQQQQQQQQQQHKQHKQQQRLLHKLRVRTYNVVPLGGVAGAIEFVRNTKSLQEILEPLHTLYGGRNEYSLRKARHAMHAKREYNRAMRIATFEDVMKHTPPQMRRFWVKRFRDPHDWLEAKTAWCRSTAVTSILGYIVGLGDRHCSNLLVDTSTGEVVHIDLGIAFDQGKQLYIPETVPFRLTRDMVDGMGVPGTNGVFTSVAETTLEVLRGEKDRIMTVLEVLRHDALYTWRLPPIRLNRVQFGSDSEAEGLVNEVPRAERGQAEHALRGVRQKLTASLSSEATVRDLVAQATDTTNLALIFSGWSPFY